MPKLVWFEIPADDIDRAKSFYSQLFGWKINPIPGMPDYLHIDTGEGEDSVDGGLMKRMAPQHTITNYVGVDSVDKYAEKLTSLGGQICKPKTEVPGMGHFVICLDPEGNTFALWERIEPAK